MADFTEKNIIPELLREIERNYRDTYNSNPTSRYLTKSIIKGCEQNKSLTGVIYDLADSAYPVDFLRLLKK